MQADGLVKIDKIYRAFQGYWLLATGAGSWIEAFASTQVLPPLRNLSWLMDSISIGPMEKRVPHYRLQEILAIVSAHGLGAFSATAVSGRTCITSHVQAERSLTSS